VVETLTCDFKITTKGDIEWYSLSKTFDVDGGSDSLFKQYESFV